MEGVGGRGVGEKKVYLNDVTQWKGLGEGEWGRKRYILMM